MAEEKMVFTWLERKWFDTQLNGVQTVVYDNISFATHCSSLSNVASLHRSKGSSVKITFFNLLDV